MRSVTIILCLVPVLLSFSHTQATIIHVPGDSSTIQGGINGAINGDTVLVAPGTYYEHINFNGKAILVTGEAGAESTIISKLVDQTPLVTFNSGEDTTSIIDGFTLRDALADGENNGAMFCQNCSPRIKNNIFTQNTVDRVVRFIDSWAHFTNNVIKDNIPASKGLIGVYCTGVSGVIMSQNLILGNLIGIDTQGDENIINSTVCNNDINILVFWTATIKNNIIVQGGQGIVVNPGGGPAISYNDVWWNLTNYSGCSPGEGDISANPLFCDPNNDNFHLHSSSPCHRAGEGGVDMGAFGVACGWVIVIPGCDQGGPPNTQASVSFYVQNLQDSTDTFDLNISDQLGWSIEPGDYEVFLDSFQVDTVDFTVSIPDVPLGTTDNICLRAIPRNSPSDSYSGCLHVICDSYNIKISDISDVGNDQGKQVRIEWFSFPGSDPLVTDFTIFRRIDSLLFASLSGNPRIFSSKDYPPGNWDMVGTYPAFGETLYSAVVSTLKDSTIAGGMHWSVFFVRGGTDNPTVYFDSPVDSGYSLDNLSPSPPTGLLASHEPALTKLTWRMTPALDFDYCTLYRDTLSGFAPDPSNRLGYTIDSTFADSTARLGKTYYYIVSATDFSGNESDPSDEAMGVRYITGDANADGGIDLADILSLITYLYKNGLPPSPPESGNVNCDGTVDLGDALYLIVYLYKNGPAPCEQ